MYKFIICFLAGVGAGLGTGFAGMSAAAVISPVLITFLDIDPFMAIGIALASDVLASAVSAYTYGKNKNLDIKNGLLLMITVLCFTPVGSYLSSLIPKSTMGNFSVCMSLLLGIRFIIKPVDNKDKEVAKKSKIRKTLQTIISGTIVGLICGFVGAGGGMMMLLLLTTVLGYELKTAVGTSVFIMAFTALTGSISHFSIGGKPDILILTYCVLSTLLWAQIAAKVANKTSPKTLNRLTGGILTILSVIIIVVNHI